MTMYRIKRVPTSGFTRCGYSVQLLNDDGSPLTRLLLACNSDGSPVRGEFGRKVWVPESGPANFYGNDGRKVRAEAIAFAKSFNATRESN